MYNCINCILYACFEKHMTKGITYVLVEHHKTCCHYFRSLTGQLFLCNRSSITRRQTVAYLNLCWAEIVEKVVLTIQHATVDIHKNVHMRWVLARNSITLNLLIRNKNMPGKLGQSKLGHYLYPCIALTSVSIVMITLDKRVTVCHEGVFQLHVPLPSQCWEMINCKYIYMYPNMTSKRQTLLIVTINEF